MSIGIGVRHFILEKVECLFIIKNIERRIKDERIREIVCGKDNGEW